MTEKELLEHVITKLNTINVPIAYLDSIITEQIANPIKESITMLTLLYSAVCKNTEENDKKEVMPESEEPKQEESISEEQEVNQNGSNE